MVYTRRARVRQGEKVSLYLINTERERVDKLAAEMNWPRSRAINALVKLGLAEGDRNRPGLMEAMVMSELDPRLLSNGD